MSPAQLNKREKILQQLWAAQDRAAPNYESPELAAAGQTAANALERLLSENADAKPSVEVGLTWRYAGDAWFCASAKTNQDHIRRSLGAYERAEALLRDSGRELDLAKLRFNYANALRQVDGDANLPALQKAQRLYYAALLTFRKLQPDGVAVTEASLRHVENALKGHEIANWAQRDRDNIGKLRSKLEATAPGNDSEVLGEVSETIERMKADPMTERSRSFLGVLATYRPTREKMGFEEQLSEFDILSGDIRRKRTDESEEVLSYLREELKRALRVPQISQKRTETLNRLLAEAETLLSQRPQTPEGVAIVRGEMRDLVLRVKPVLTAAARPRHP